MSDRADTSLAAAIGRLVAHLSPARRRQLIMLFGLMLLGAVAELITIGAILPLLALLSGTSGSAGGRLLEPLNSILPGGQLSRAVVLTAAFAGAAVVAAAIRLWLLWATDHFVYGIAHDLSVNLYRLTLYQPYAFHTSHNSSDILASTNKAQIVTGEVLLPLMLGCSAAMISLFIIVGLVVIDPVVATISGLGFGAIYLVVMWLTRATMRRNSAVIAAAQSERVQFMREGLGGIRDVLIDRSQAHFVGRVADVEARFRDARATNSFLSGAPRFLVEGAGMVLIAVVAVILSNRDGGLAASIPVLGALALGSQRLLPLLQLVYSGWARATGNQRVLLDLLALLDLKMPPHALAAMGERLPFTRDVVLRHVSFRYAEDLPFAVEDFSLDIRKGARIGFVGKTGSGKSTLMDLVLGLLSPTQGDILVDDVLLTDANRSGWQGQIAHVPQAIYLADASIAENIAFGVPRAEIDRARVIRAAEQAELGDVIAALPGGYETRIGERGIRLSGGQRQRLGIARALYKQAQVLVFDEATSALDTDTEAAVMRAINGLGRDLTILIIAHRLTTVAECDQVVRLDQGHPGPVQGARAAT